MITRQAITILKLNHLGQEVIRYSAESLHQTPISITVRATFTHPTKVTSYTTFRTGDVLNEHFYSDRWYNVFALYNGSTQQFKGWYCNICRPANWGNGYLRCEDLALDVWVSPSGEATLLDEEEFAQLNLPIAEQTACFAAVSDIQQLANTLPR